VLVELLSNDPETPTTRRIRLAVDGIRFNYRAGQAASLAAGGGKTTPYSIASAPYETAQDGWLEFLVKVDGSSRFGAIVESLEPGVPVDVAGPAGSFVLPPASREVPILFIAGGTGIAPMRSMIRDALHAGHPGRLSLVYSARTPDEFAYLREMRTLADEGRLALTLTLTGQFDDWAHARGRTGAEHLAELVQPGTLAFVCGPPAMVADLPVALAALGVPRERVRTDGW
jgi:ferredoxin-NADP reductase